MNLDRAPLPRLLDALEHGLLVPLRDRLHIDVAGARVPLDPHFRAGRRIDLYAGQTVVLGVHVGEDGVARPTAHPTYAVQPCAAALLRPFAPDEGSAFRDALARYLEGVVVDRRWVHREGRVQQRWMGLDGTSARAPWIPIDREVVFAGDERAREDVTVASAVGVAFEAVDRLAFMKGWKAPTLRAYAEEVDQLAIDPTGRRILLLELKPREASDAYHAPLQVFRYLDAWRGAFAADRPSLVGSLEAMGNARARVGFGPAIPKVADDATLVPVIAFGDPPTGEVLARTFDAVGAIERAVGAGCLDGLELWAWPEGGAPRRLGAADLPKRRRARRCRACRAEAIIPIIRGEPTEEAWQMSERGEVALGGCMVSPGDPRYCCRECGEAY